MLESNAAVMKGFPPTLPHGSTTAPGSLNAADVIAMDTLLSRQLVEGLVSLLVKVPLRYIHNRCTSVFYIQCNVLHIQYICLCFSSWLCLRLLIN